MTTIEHASLKDPEIHEPKGAAAATADEIFIADGAASGAFDPWNNMNKVWLLIPVALSLDVVSTVYYVIPVAGSITKIWSSLQSSITGSDCTVTTNIGGVPITSGALTITVSGSAAGDVDSATPTGNNTVASGSLFTAVSDGNAGGASDTINIVIEVDTS